MAPANLAEAEAATDRQNIPASYIHSKETLRLWSYVNVVAALNAILSTDPARQRFSDRKRAVAPALLHVFNLPELRPGRTVIFMPVCRTEVMPVRVVWRIRIAEVEISVYLLSWVLWKDPR